MSEVSTGAQGEYAPCPLCKQYSHSIGCDNVAAAFNHFHTMIAHPVRGHPMGHAFDEQTRDAAQVMMSLRTPEPAGDLVERIKRAIIAEYLDWSLRREAGLTMGESMARAAIAAMPDHAALVDELTTLRTQLAASQADVARLREALFMIEAIGDGSKTANSLPNIAGIARAAIKDTQP